MSVCTIQTARVAFLLRERFECIDQRIDSIQHGVRALRVARTSVCLCPSVACHCDGIHIGYLFRTAGPLHLQSPGEIKRREASWTLMKKLDTFAGPVEIKRREVSWTLTKKLDAFAGPGEIKRREVVLDPSS